MLDILKKTISTKPKLKRTFQSSLFILYSTAIGIFFLGDIFRKIAIYFECEFTRYSTISKVVVLILYFLFFIFNFKRYTEEEHFTKMITAITILTCTFIIGQISLSDSISQPLNFFLNIEYLVKYLYLPVTILMFSSLKNEIKYVKKIIFFIEFIFIINLIFILIGFCFDINVFSTYVGDRFGYIGIFSRSGQTSFFFIMFILFYYRLLMDRLTKTNIFKFMFFIAVSLLLGTKRIYIFLVLLSLYYFFIQKGFRNLITYKFLIIAILVGICFKQNVIDSFNKIFLVSQKIYYNNGFISSLTSYRSDLFYNTFSQFVKNNWTFKNYIFGGPSFQNYIFITGMDFFDLYLFFGLTGMVVFLKIFNFLVDFKVQGNFMLFYFSTLAITSFFSSAFLYDPYVNLLFVIMIWYYSHHEKNKSTNTIKQTKKIEH
tara:strand:+ start:133 stop:1422 length:1290 start_codon:yes stop_codon:yes gene_type:complete